MAITILRRGVNPTEQPFSVTCRNCDTQYQAKPSDCRRVNDQRDGDYYVFQCQVCPKQVTIDADKVNSQQAIARS